MPSNPRMAAHVAACERGWARVGWIRARRPATCSAGPAAQPEIVGRQDRETSHD
jgi:hypothetical protein